MNYDFKKASNTLIENLILKGIKNKSILDAFRNIPRHLFLNSELHQYAYEDRALPIESNQTISQPYTIAFMLELLDIQNKQKVLEIGTGSTYLTFLLDYLGAEIYTIERDEVLYKKALKVFQDNNKDFYFKLGDGSLGWDEFAPYHRIIISAAAPEFPIHLKDQLYENGIIVCPVGNIDSQKMIKGILVNSKFTLYENSDFKFVPLIGKYGFEK